MNAETTIDWECWEVEQPPAGFVDRVMDGVQSEPCASGAVRRSMRPVRRMTALAAAAVAVGSLTVLAMIGRSVLRGQAPSSDAMHVPSVQPSNVPPSAKSDEVAKGSTASVAPPHVKHAPGTIVDRQRRDAVRAEVVPPLVAGGVERDSHTGLTIPAGTTGPSHNLSKEYLQARIHEDFYPLAAACYASALARQPTLRGKVVVDFMIVGDAKSGGIVDQAEINDRTDIGDRELTTCLRESMLSMVFAPPENNGWVTVTYPFAFSPDDDDDDEATRDN